MKRQDIYYRGFCGNMYLPTFEILIMPLMSKFLRQLSTQHQPATFMLEIIYVVWSTKWLHRVFAKHKEFITGMTWVSLRDRFVYLIHHTWA